MAQSRRHERPRRSRLQHSNSGGAMCLSSASVAQMLAAASIKVMDALFGFLARNDAECCKRELLGRSWRRDWAMRNFQEICTKSDPQKKIKQKILWVLGWPKHRFSKRVRGHPPQELVWNFSMGYPTPRPAPKSRCDLFEPTVASK